MKELIEQKSIDNFFADFNDDEKLVAKSILSMKMITGLSGRICNKANEIEGINLQTTFFKLTDYLDNVAAGQNKLFKEYAAKLGISEQRYREIADFVYTHETEI